MEVHKPAEGRGISPSVILLLVAINAGRTLCPISYRATRLAIEHEATTSRISEDQLFYCLQRGMDEEESVSLIVNGFCKEVMKELPMEFAVEAQKLIGISLEGSVDTPAYR